MNLQRSPLTLFSAVFLFLSLIGCGDDAPVVILDGGPRVIFDAGPPPGYSRLPLECVGTPTSCGDRDVADCSGGGGCSLADGCEGTAAPASCVSRFSAGSCASVGCSWNDSLNFCLDPAGTDCSLYSLDRLSSAELLCTNRAGCAWGATCQGTASACASASLGDCTSIGCETGCSGDRTECSNQCVDAMLDPFHCGGCGIRCGTSGFECIEGTCECPSPRTEDGCGVCDDDPSNDCVQDCEGVWGGPAVLDMCGACDDDPATDCEQDCEGVWGGPKTMDDCGVCDADPMNDCDCAGVPGGSSTLDYCDVCDADPANDCDCALVVGGSALEDGCGVCDSDPMNDCVQDCAGVWGGAAYEDSCGTCDDIPGNDCPPCDGTSVLGACWYLTADNGACSTFCASHGAFDEATVTVAGSGGTSETCESVLTALGHPGNVLDSPTTLPEYAHLGCVVQSAGGMGRFRYNAYVTWDTAHHAGYLRACACTE